MIKPYDSINTFNRRPVPAQIVTYLVFVGEMLTFFICMYVNFRHTPTQIAILVCYIVTVLIQIAITLRVSCIDPSDNIMISYRTDPRNRYIPHQFRQNININQCLYCDICTSYVKQTSRHCKVCQRCVEDFDHHCMWVNNCVGSKNYKEFMVMILVTLFNMVVYIVGMALLWNENQWREYVGPMVALWVFSVIPVIFSILLINLVALHIYLISKGITTYQFIMLQRDEARKKEEQKAKSERLAEARHPTIAPVGKNLEEQQNQPDKSQQLVQTSNQELPTQNNFKSLEKSQNIFGINEPSNESKTQKSMEEPSTKEKAKKSKGNNISIHENQRIQGPEQELYDEEPSSFNSKKQMSDVNVSRFFIKNKSIKFFIGDEIGSRPKSTMRNTKGASQNLYQSLKVNREDKSKNQSMYVSEVKNYNEFPESKSSVSLKAINPKN